MSEKFTSSADNKIEIGVSSDLANTKSLSKEQIAERREKITPYTISEYFREIPSYHLERDSSFFKEGFVDIEIDSETIKKLETWSSTKAAFEQPVILEKPSYGMYQAMSRPRYVDDRFEKTSWVENWNVPEAGSLRVLLVKVVDFQKALMTDEKLRSQVLREKEVGVDYGVSLHSYIASHNVKTISWCMDQLGYRPLSLSEFSAFALHMPDNDHRFATCISESNETINRGSEYSPSLSGEYLSFDLKPSDAIIFNQNYSFLFTQL